MKKTLLLLASALVLQLSFAQSTKEERRERITASYLMAFGILPEQSEMDYWINDPLAYKTVADLVAEHKKNISRQQDLQDRAIRISYFDAFGRAPRTDEYVTWRPLKLTYTDLMARHMQYLKEYPSEFEAVIKRTYVNEFSRKPSAQELANWKSWGIRSYLEIAREHQKNKRAGLFAPSKSGTTAAGKVLSNKQSGIEFTPSSKILNEIRIDPNARCISTGGGNVISTGGGNVISTGGGNVISTGGGN